MGRGILLILILFLILFMDRPLRGSCLPSRLVCFLNTERLRIESRNAFTVTGRLKETKRLPLRMMDRDDENTTDEEGIKLSREWSCHAKLYWHAVLWQQQGSAKKTTEDKKTRTSHAVVSRTLQQKGRRQSSWKSDGQTDKKMTKTKKRVNSICLQSSSPVFAVIQQTQQKERHTDRDCQDDDSQEQQLTHLKHLIFVHNRQGLICLDISVAKTSFRRLSCRENAKRSQNNNNGKISTKFLVMKEVLEAWRSFNFKKMIGFRRKHEERRIFEEVQDEKKWESQCRCNHIDVQVQHACRQNL